jgi:iron(III) transport system ATP-binding protein
MYLVLEDVVKIFPARGGSGEVTAVDHVDIEIEKGELVTLLGPSGCGKTTTLRLIAGFEFPTQGTIHLDGQVINQEPPHKRDMSMVFQSYAIFPHLSVYENTAYGLNVQRLPKAKVQERVARALALVELTGLEKRAPNQLSGGQMRTEIRRIQQRLGITSVYVTHDQVEAMTLSDRIVVMNEGKIEQIGSPIEIYRRPRTRFVADFIGRANFVECSVQDQRGNDLLLDLLGAPMTVPAPETYYWSGEKVTAVIRPEMVEIDSPQSHVEGIVRRATYLGNVIEYDVEVAGQLLALVENDPRHTTVHAEGQTVRLRFLEDCLYVLPQAS